MVYGVWQWSLHIFTVETSYTITDKFIVSATGLGSSLSSFLAGHAPTFWARLLHALCWCSWTSICSTLEAYWITPATRIHNLFLFSHPELTELLVTYPPASQYDTDYAEFSWQYFDSDGALCMPNFWSLHRSTFGHRAGPFWCLYSLRYLYSVYYAPAKHSTDVFPALFPVQSWWDVLQECSERPCVFYIWEHNNTVGTSAFHVYCE